MLVAFDLEGTLLDGELFPRLGAKLGKRELLARLTEDAMNGHVAFEEAFLMRLDAIRGTPIELVLEASLELPLHQGAEEALAELRARGAELAIITGSFDVVANRVAKRLKVPHVVSNRFVLDGGRVAGHGEPLVTPQLKAERLSELTRGLGLTPGTTVVVGDGANDVPMMRAAGLSIAFNAKKPVEQVADVSLRGTDLRAILPYIESFARNGRDLETRV